MTGRYKNVSVVFFSLNQWDGETGGGHAKATPWRASTAGKSSPAKKTYSFSRSVVMCHPGFVDAELQRLDPLTELREKEYVFFAGDEFPAVLARHGVALA